MSDEEKTINIVAIPGRRDRRGFSRDPEELVEQAVSVGKLQQKFTQFMSAVEEMLAVEQPSTGAFQLTQIQFSAEISAEGEFKLLGSGVGISAGSAITFTLERKP